MIKKKKKKKRHTKVVVIQKTMVLDFFFFSFITLTCIDTKNNIGNKIKIQMQT